MSLSSDDAPTLPAGVTLSSERQAAAELQHETKKLVIAIEEQIEVKRARLVELGMDNALAVMEARKKALEDHGDRLTKIQERCMQAMEGDTPELQALALQDPVKAADRLSRIGLRYAQTLKITEDVRNLQSTHPMLDQKATFIGKVDARQIQMTPEQARERFAKFKTVEPE